MNGPVAGAEILGLGYYLPATVVTNDDLTAGGTHASPVTDEWTRSRTGIVSRRFAGPDESVVEMAVAAAAKAMAAAGRGSADVDLILLATCSMPSPIPNGASLIAYELGAAAPAAIDLNVACAGFCHALAIADSMVRTGAGRHVLVIGAERMRDLVDPRDRSTSIVFADGAGAALVGPASISGIGPVVWGSDGGRAELIHVRPGDRAIAMQGQAVFRWAVTELAPVARAACDRAGVAPTDLAGFVPHQANARIIDALAEALDLDGTAIARDVVDSGNTSAASIPLALARMVERDEVSPGAPVLLFGFGAGLTWAAQVVRCPPATRT